MLIKETAMCRSKKFSQRVVTVTDPCYNKDVGGGFDVPIFPGNYECLVKTVQLTDEDWDNEEMEILQGRVHTIGIYLEGCRPEEKDMERIGSIGVDSGLAGFFQNKPDYTADEWNAICDLVRVGYGWVIKEGLFSKSGLGDGEYNVYAYRSDHGRCLALEIRFLEDDL